MRRSRKSSSAVQALRIVSLWLATLSILMFSSTTVSAATANSPLLESNLSPEAGFVETFDDVPGLPADSFSRTVAGVQFDFVFTGEGDGGNGQGFAHEDLYGEANGDSINLQSGAFDASAIEKVTITRNDGQPFVFSSIFIRNTAGDTITVAGYHNGTIVGTAETMANGDAGTLSFNSIVVDEVRLTSPDFLNTNIDSFTGDTGAPTAVTLSDFQAVNLQKGVALWFVLIGLVATSGIAITLRRFAHLTRR